MRVARKRLVNGAWLGLVLVFALGCRSGQTKQQPADASHPSADAAGDSVADASSACVCGTSKPAVSVGTCLFSNACPLGDFFRISVKLDGVALPRDQTRANGWDYTSADMTSIQLFGPPCQAVTNGTATSVMFDYSCANP